METFWKRISGRFDKCFVDLELEKMNVGMHKELILLAFEKGMVSLEEKGVPAPSKSAIAELLSEHIDLEYNFQFGERRLRDYYNAALKEEEIEIKQQAVRDGLSHYLGYKSFEDWLLKTNRLKMKDEEDSKETESHLYFILQFLRRNKTTLYIAMSGLIIFLIINTFNSERWMMWEGNQFVEAEFDGHKIESGQLFMFNETQMNRFKKVEPNCDTKFFNADGKAQLWYGKNSKGVLEYFTELGKHPETGKSLRPITKYMIKKYICDGKNGSEKGKTNS